MKKTIFKLLLLMVSMTALTSMAKAQVYCPPTPSSPPECSNCPGIWIVNTTGVTLTFYWEYNNGTCTEYAIAGQIDDGDPPTYIPGFCLSFCDEDCVCNSWLRVGDCASNGGYVNWSYNAGNPGSYSTSGFTYCAPSSPVSVTANYDAPTNTMTFGP